MSTPLAVPEITVFPSDIPTGEEGKVWYAWTMKLYEEDLLRSEDHGDDFETVREALDHAFSVFEDLVDRRQVYPSRDAQEFSLMVKRAP